MADTVGFAHLDWQVDSIVSRTDREFGKDIASTGITGRLPWRLAICPHDDYAYANWHYRALLRNIKAKTIFVFGVAHKARALNIQDRIVFDSYGTWHGPYGNIRVSPLRDELMTYVAPSFYLVSDSLQRVEHSVESMLPFLQHENRALEIISILVPAMDTARMTLIAKQLASGISTITMKHNLAWGKDYALLVTTDAVHYGDEDWGGKNMAPFGVDSSGYARAVRKEHAILDSCLSGPLTMEKARLFSATTVQSGDFREYRWTWCGRYSVPFGLRVAQNLQALTHGEILSGTVIGYSTSISQPPLKVDDLHMGQTAKATLRHWVGYASVGYE